MKRIIYHGSVRKVEKPIFNFDSGNNDLDYGRGFYCTEDIEIAKEWACKEKYTGRLNVYEIDDSDLNILDLTDKKYSILNWIAILFNYRLQSASFRIDRERELKYLQKYYIDINQYDVVIGYRADDSYYQFPKEFLDNNITLERFEEVFKNGDLGVQYVLISKKAFERICFIDCENVDDNYINLYNKRINDASNRFDKILKEERYTKGKRLRDLLSE